MRGEGHRPGICGRRSGRALFEGRGAAGGETGWCSFPRKALDPAGVLEDLRKVEGRARQRTLEDQPAMVDGWLDLVRKARRIARRCGPDRGVWIRGDLDGGAVPNSYGYAASGSEVTLAQDGLVIQRGRARVRSYGRGPRGSVWIEKAAVKDEKVRACLKRALPGPLSVSEF